MGNLKRKDDVGFLKARFAGDDSCGAQAAALISLGKCGTGDPGVPPFLKKAAGTKSPLNILKRAAEWALSELEGN